MGAGAVGCYYGGMLARAGHDVTLIACAQHVEVVRRSGLRMETKAFDANVPMQASAASEVSVQPFFKLSAARHLLMRRGWRAGVAKKKEVQPPPQLYTEADKERPKPEASKSAEGVRGRPYRSAWQRDRARLLHCPSFRRLQGKTQLFPSPESDFFRNRLTHSLEVAQIAKVIAIKANSSSVLGDLPIDLDLIEFAGLAHDLGHPPFGHNGEEALHELMEGKGGFEGNLGQKRSSLPCGRPRLVQCGPSLA